MVELTYFDQNVYFFWLTGYEIIVNIVIFIHHLLFKTLKRPNSQTHSRKHTKVPTQL